MSAYTLPGLMHNAFMAGKYSVDVETYMRKARREKTPQDRCHWVKGARKANRRMVDCLRRARGIV
jgi:hypothetical protein